jgi:hypothetical protein
MQNHVPFVSVVHCMVHPHQSRYLNLEQVEFNFQDQMNPYLHPWITILFKVLCGILKLTSMVNFWNPNGTIFLKT